MQTLNLASGFSGSFFSSQWQIWAVSLAMFRTQHKSSGVQKVISLCFYSCVVFYYKLHCIELAQIALFFRLFFFFFFFKSMVGQKTADLFYSCQVFEIIFSRHHIFDVNSNLLTKDLSISFRERHPIELRKKIH